MWLVLSVYIVFVVVRPHEWVPALAGIPVLAISASLAFAMWMFRGGKKLNTPQHLGVPLFVFAAIFSRVAMGWASGAVKAAEDLVPFLMIFCATTLVAEEPEELERFLKTLVLSAIVLMYWMRGNPVLDSTA